MSRTQRIHVPGGTYYVIQLGNERHPIFGDPNDYALFKQLLQMSSRRSGAHLYAYCLTATSYHLVLEIGQTSLGQVMQGLNSRFVHRQQQRTGHYSPFFSQRYRSVLLEPERYLLKLIHYVHYIPVLRSIAPSPDVYPHTSHRAYVGHDHESWVHKDAVLRLLNTCSEHGVTYETFMAKLPAANTRELFECHSRNMSGVLGAGDFIESLPRNARLYSRRVSLDDAADKAARLVGVSRAEMVSPAKEHQLALARALMAWYTMERRIGSLLEVARYVRRSPSTLSAGIARHRMLRPELFTLDAFRYLTPIAVVRNERDRRSAADL